MRSLPERFDILIVGAGPAGITAAIRLLDMGYNVGLIEQEVFPRQQIGESLSPGIRNIFAYLGAGELLDGHRYLNNIPARVHWDTGLPVYVSSEQRGPGIVVDRGILDQQLLELARSKGLHVFQPAKLMSSFYDDGIWKLDMKAGSFLRTVFSTVVLDARGRKGSLLHERLETAPSSVAIWTHVPAAMMPSETLIEAIEDGWLWGSPVRGDRYRVMAFTDSGAVKGKNLSAHFLTMLSKAGLLEAVEGQLHGNDLQTCPVTSFIHKEPWDRQFIKIGEAAFTLDPLSSTGVEKAMRFAMQTAVAVHTLLRYQEGSVAQAFYEEKLMESAVNHARWTSAYYTSSRFSKGHYAFWDQRTNFQLDGLKLSNDFTRRFYQKFSQPLSVNEVKKPPAIPVNALMDYLWNKPVRLSPRLTYSDEFAVTGDRVEIRRAVNHPALENPIVYLNHTELNPLLSQLSEGVTYGGLADIWSKSLHREETKRIITFLWSHTIFLSD